MHKKRGPRTLVYGGSAGEAGNSGAQRRVASGLERFGWSEGRNIQITYRFPGGSAEQAAALAKELVAQKPDLIVATATSLAAALQRETQVIPWCLPECSTRSARD